MLPTQNSESRLAMDVFLLFEKNFSSLSKLFLSELAAILISEATTLAVWSYGEQDVISSLGWAGVIYMTCIPKTHYCSRTGDNAANLLPRYTALLRLTGPQGT